MQAEKSGIMGHSIRRTSVLFYLIFRDNTRVTPHLPHFTFWGSCTGCMAVHLTYGSNFPELNLQKIFFRVFSFVGLSRRGHVWLHARENQPYVLENEECSGYDQGMIRQRAGNGPWAGENFRGMVVAGSGAIGVGGREMRRQMTIVPAWSVCRDD